MNYKFDSIESALEDIKAGKIVIVADDSDRENEGDLVCAAEMVSPEIINFMTKFGRGLICLTLDSQVTKKLNLNEMVNSNTELMQTAFTVSVDADPKYGVSTGISASDRAKTIQVAIANDTKPEDLRRPGHIFPLRSVEGGVLRRVGHTEASVDLARLAGLKSSGVICEILKEDGEMARRDDLFEYAKRHNLKFITIADLVAYRLKKERFVERITNIDFPCKYGDGFKLHAYKDYLSNEEHIALSYGDLESAVKNNEDILVRVHSECLTGDLFACPYSKAGDLLDKSVNMIKDNGFGVIVYLRHESRKNNLGDKIKAYKDYQDGKSKEVNIKFPMDLRSYGVGAQILSDLGLKKIKIISSTPKKIHGIEGFDLEIDYIKPLDNIQKNTIPTISN